jgi:F-type H+-transporting ATPase subunit alpha
MPAEKLEPAFDRAFGGIRQVREAFVPRLAPHEVGTVTHVAAGIAMVSGSAPA